MNRRALAYGAVAGAVLLLGLPLLRYPYGFDHAYFASFAEILRQGGVAYRDTFEIRPPGTTYVFYATSLLLGRSPVAVRVVDLVALVATALALVCFAERRLKSRAAGIAAALSLPLLYLPFGYWHTTEPESFLLPFLAWGLALAPDRGARPRAGLLPGVLFGAALLFKPTIVLVPAVLVAERLWGDRDEKTWRARLGRASTFALGIAAPAALLAAYYASRGALAAAWDAAVAYPSAYAGLGYRRTAFVDLVDRALWWTSHYYRLPVLALALLGLLPLTRGARGEALRLVVLGAAAYLSAVGQAKFYASHFIVGLPFLAILIGANALEPPWPLRGLPWRAVLLRAGAAATAAVLAVAPLWRYARETAPEWKGEERPDVRRLRAKDEPVAHAIRARTREGDRIFVWGNAPMLYVLSGRSPATRHVESATIVALWSGRRREREIVDTLRKNPPPLIVTCRRDALDHATGREEGTEELLAVFTDFRDFLTAGYTVAETLGEHRVWVRSSP